jgi:hypothetical protein
MIVRLSNLKLLILTLCITSFTSSKAQNTNEAREVYYGLISDIIFQDTLVPNWKAKIIEAEVEHGQLTKADSAKYYQIIKNQRLLLNHRQANSEAKKALTNDLEGGHILTSLFTENELKTIINNFPEEDGLHNPKNIPEKIKLLEYASEWELYHKFSSPVSLGENRFLVYHYMSTGRFNLKYGVILFSISNQGYTIDKEIILKQITM